jgi:hypothetical protein
LIHALTCDNPNVVGILESVELPALMAMTSGRRDVVVGMLDGPVAFGHPELTSANIYEIPGVHGWCANPSSMACQHGTFVAGILVGSRGSLAPAICPDCSLLVRPIFPDALADGEQLPSARSDQVALAIRGHRQLGGAGCG